MKKIFLIAAISIGLIFSATAQKKNHSNHNNQTSNKSSHSSHKSPSYNRGSYSKGTYSRGSSRRGSYNSGHNHSSYGHSGGHSGGHYEYVSRRVWSPGCSTRVWIPARYVYQRQSCGRVIRVCVSNGHYDTRYSQGRYEYKQVKVYRQSSHHNSGISVSWRY